MANAYLWLEEVAEETRTPLSTVRQWIAQRKLPSVRPGRRRLVKRADLDAFMAPPASVAANAPAVEPTDLDRQRASKACRRLGLQP
jgi:excisionase family DNA binding protein